MLQWYHEFCFGGIGDHCGKDREYAGTIPDEDIFGVLKTTLVKSSPVGFKSIVIALFLRNCLLVETSKLSLVAHKFADGLLAIKTNLPRGKVIILL